jgi:NADH:ubiquinone oxidoreductase subunit 3 (subunit A)
MSKLYTNQVELNTLECLNKMELYRKNWGDITYHDHHWHYASTFNAIEEISSLDRRYLFWIDNYKIIIIFLISFGLATLLLFLSYFLSFDKVSYEDKNLSYECGFDPFNDSRSGFDIHYYLVAILFIIFDLEIMFLFPWAFALNSIIIKGPDVRLVIPQDNIHRFMPELDNQKFHLFDYTEWSETYIEQGKVPNIKGVPSDYFILFFRYEDFTGHYFVLTFLLILVIGFIYEWRKGGLDW